MKYLYSFKIFEEVKLIDLSNIKGEGEMAMKFREFQNKIKFEIDEDFIKEIPIKIDNKIVNLKINYADDINHSIIDRIKNRTNLKSISEFNDKMKKVVNELFPNKIHEKITVDDKKYTVYLENSKYSFIFAIKYNRLINNKYSIVLKTIINGMTDYGILIKIDD